MQHDFDTVIAGAGVVGLAIARALAPQGPVLILEGAERIGSATSSRNSGVIHAGLYYAPGSLRAKLCVRGRHLLYQFCGVAGVAHRACGKLVVATDDTEIPALESLHAQGVRNGVEDLRIITGAEARAMEPSLRCTAAIWSPHTGIVDAHGLMQALLAAAVAEGAVLAVHAPFDGASALPGGGFAIRAGGATITAGRLILAAGHGAAAAAARIEGLDPAFIPRAHLCRGNYFALAGHSPFTHLIYPMPIPGGAGIHLTLDLSGAARFGPDVEPVDAPEIAVNTSRAPVFYEAIRRYWPGLPDGALHPAWAGLRPKIVPSGQTADFCIQGPAAHGVDGLVTLFGIESPGLTSCLAIADYVVGLCS